MEELLNKLIEKGWKPFGDNAIKIEYDGMKTRCGYGAITYKYRGSYIYNGDEVEYEEWRYQFNNRELVSKESGLWQFVCKNGMVEEESFQSIEDKEICTSDEWKCYYNDDGYPRDNYYTLDRTDAEFWIIESALKDESKLEQFLLDNINV